MAQELKYKSTIDTSSFDTGMNNMASKINNLDKLANNAIKGFIGGKLLGMATDFGKAAIEGLSNYEKFSASLTTMLHGNKEAAEALNGQLVNLAKTTPFSLADVQTGTKNLMAYGFQAGDITKNLTMLGNVASGVGAPLNDIVYLYGTLRSSGRVTLMDIRQFAGRGIPIYEALQKTLHKTTDEILDMVHKGKLGFSDIEKAFKGMTQEGGQFFNLMEDQSKTVGGKISNMGDSWEQLQLHIAQSQRGIIASTIDMVNSIIGSLDRGVQANNQYDKSVSDLSKNYQFGNKGFFDSMFKGSSTNQYYATGEGNGFIGHPKYFFGKDAQQQAQSYADKNGGFIGKMGQNEAVKNLAGAILDIEQSQVSSIQKYRDLEKLQQDVRGSGISAELFVNEQHQLSAAFNRWNQAAKLSGMKTPPTDLGGKGKGEEGIAAPTEYSGKRPQNVNININELIGIKTLNSTSTAKSYEDSKEAFLNILLDAVADINKITGTQ
jgi:tape measure domain-containing protein